MVLLKDKTMGVWCVLRDTQTMCGENFHDSRSKWDLLSPSLAQVWLDLLADCPKHDLMLRRPW